MFTKYFIQKLYRFLYNLPANQQAKLYEKFKNSWQQNVYSGYKGKYALHESFKFNGANILFYGDGLINAGSDSYIGSGSTVQAAPGKKVSIGKRCSISHNVRMYTSSRDPNQDLAADKDIVYLSGDITIEDGVWIGANVFINPGITIGHNAIVGANAVLTKNVEANSIVGGVPAKFIKYKKID